MIIFVYLLYLYSYIVIAITVICVSDDNRTQNEPFLSISAYTAMNVL
ncbi:hypothetical protein [Segatella oris]|nr:hypothetical protein [Segatella oris]